MHRRADGTVVAAAWGPGAEWALQGLPDLLGARDRPEDFVAHHPLVAEAHRRMPGLRFGASLRVWDVLLPAVLEQKVTGVEARRSWRELCWRFGEPAPGPAPAGMRVPPTPAVIRTVPDWEWHRAGVDNARRRAILAAAAVAHRLEAACKLGGEPGRQLLRRVPGIGIWTAAEVAQRAWGDPDATANNEGPRWEYLSGGFAGNNVASLALDPNDAAVNTIWAGTGEPNACGSGCEAGVGIYMSTNGGRTWKGPIGASSSPTGPSARSRSSPATRR